MPAVTSPQSTLVEPPEGRARLREAESAVHELRIAKAKPSMLNGEKWRLSSCFLPMAASCSWSCTALLLRLGAMFSSVLSVVYRDSCQTLINGEDRCCLDSNRASREAGHEVRHDRPIASPPHRWLSSSKPCHAHVVHAPSRPRGQVTIRYQKHPCRDSRGDDSRLADSRVADRQLTPLLREPIRGGGA